MLCLRNEGGIERERFKVTPKSLREHGKKNKTFLE